MRPAFPSRRAAQFDALLDGALDQAPTAELAELLAVAERVRAVPEVAPRVEFAASLRERLMAEAPEALAAPSADDTARLTVGHRTPSKTSPQTSRERRIGLAIAAFSLVGASAATAVASQGSMPGDTLYPVKRLIENARTSLTMGDDAKADVLLSHARTRLDEVRRLGGREDVDTGQVEQTLRDFGDSADHASTVILAEYADHGDQQKIDELRTFTQQSVTTLSELTTLLPPSVDDVLAEVTHTLLTIDQSAAQACPSCDASGVFELPSTLVDLLAAPTGGAAQTGTSTTQPNATGENAGKTKKPAAPSPGATEGPGPSTQLTDPLTNATGGGAGGDGDQPSAGATSLGGAVGGTVGGVGGAVGGTVGGVGGAVDDLGDEVGGPVGGVIGGVGGTVDDLGETVGGVTGGVGGILSGPTPTPTP